MESTDLLIFSAVFLKGLRDVSICFLDLSVGQLICVVLLPDGAGDSVQTLLVLRLMLKHLLALIDDLVILLRLQLAVCDIRPASQFKFLTLRLCL